MIVLRVPYPLGFYAKGFDGRIDDPKAGWNGRGLWTTSGDRAPWLKEGGKGRTSIAVHFQLRSAGELNESRRSATHDSTTQTWTQLSRCPSAIGLSCYVRHGTLRLLQLRPKTQT